MIAPILKLDGRERWRPQPVETVEELGKIGSKPIDLSALPAAGGRMNFPSGMKDPGDTPVVGYHRVLKAVDLWWHQFWLWYLYNPWEIAGIGRHEGDWEFVQTACVDKAGNRPVLMTASQHRTGEKREFWRCELDGGRPIIYVARHSHAELLHPGRPRRGRGRRPRRPPRRNRVARLRRLGGLAGHVGQLDRRRTLARVAGTPARALGVPADLPRAGAVTQSRAAASCSPTQRS